MTEMEGKTISLKCLSDDGSDPEYITVKGTGDFAVGLTSQDKILSCKTNNKNGCLQICVPLFKLTIWPTEGVTLTPVNRDLACVINEEDVLTETNLTGGMKIEIGDKVIEYMEGPIARPRRHLPPTPGVHVRASPPPKPTRNRPSPQPVIRAHVEEDTDWCHIDIPTVEEELVEKLNTCEELANMSASCINKQIHQYTDIHMTASLMDDIYKMLMEVGTHRKDILKSFLREISCESRDTPESDKGRPLHNPVIILLVEVLKQFMDPVSLVILCLKLLRSLSHVHSNLPTFINTHATAAILGSMTVYVDEVEIQQNGIDILCKVATYKPAIDEKAPMRETAIELILRAMRHHHDTLFVIQSGCRTLASLSMMLFELTNSIIDNDTGQRSSSRSHVEKLVNLLCYIKEHATGVVHDAMQNFTSDLSVSMEARRFLFVMARLDQMQHKQTLWVENESAEVKYDQHAELDRPEQEQNLMSDEDNHEGILKRSRSYENLRSRERKVSFIDVSGPGNYETSSDDSSDSDKNDKKCEVTIISERVITNGLTTPKSQSMGENRSYTTNDIDEGLKKTETTSKQSENSSKICDNDLTIQDGRPDLVTSTLPVVESVNNVSLFSELGALDPGLARRLEESEREEMEEEVIDVAEEEAMKVRNYSAADTKFLNRLVKTQIACKVCSYAFIDEDKEAYAMIERPISEVLKSEKMSPTLSQFFASQYKPELTMMDFDTNIVISLIDAVRYRSQVAPDVVQKILLGVARNIENSIDQRFLKLSAKLLAKILDEPSLLLTVSDETFHAQMQAQLEESCKRLSDPSIFADVLNKVTPGHSLMDLDCY